MGLANRPYLLAAAAFTAIVFSAHSLALANLLTNGDFESGANPPQSAGDESLPTGSTAITGWTVTGGHTGDGLAWLVNGNPYGVSAQSGVDFVDLTGYNDTTPFFGISQSVATTVGQAYSLTFQVGVDNNNSNYTGPVSLTASADATSQSFNNINPSGTGNIWTPETLNFTATNPNTLITFTGIQGKQYIGLDNVSLVAAPEPASLTLFAVAPLLLRRKK